MIPELLAEAGQTIDLDIDFLTAPVYKNTRAAYHQIGKVHRGGASIIDIGLFGGANDWLCGRHFIWS